MANVLLFHSVLGLRRAEHEIAAEFQADGHTVALPDLYDGRSTQFYPEGFEIKDAIGDAAIEARAREAVAAAPEDAVLAGVSYGAYLIGPFWGDRPKMRGALLFAGVAPWMTPRRKDMRVSVHVAQPDPYDDEAFFAEWVADAGGVPLEMHRYAGAGHYFLDRSLPDFNAEAAALCLERARAFLGGL